MVAWRLLSVVRLVDEEAQKVCVAASVINRPMSILDRAKPFRWVVFDIAVPVIAPRFSGDHNGLRIENNCDRGLYLVQFGEAAERLPNSAALAPGPVDAK